MIHNVNRIAHFTSSEIWRLMGGAPGVLDSKAKTYIQEKIDEKRLGKSIREESYKFEMFWGNFLESILFELLGIEWKISSKETTLHPKYGDFWAGSVDLIVPKVKAGEIKGFQYKNFCKLANCLRKKDVPLLKKTFPALYWQIVSNCLIHKVWTGEAILYMPYESEIPAILELAEKMAEENPEDAWKYYKISTGTVKTLPCLKDGGYYENITSFEFKILQEDAQFCIDKVKLAGAILKAA